MKNAWRAKAVAAILSALVVAGCSSTQPDRIETRTTSLSFETKGSVYLWDCYESPFVTCFPALDEHGVQKFADRSLPWRYSVKITIIRAGTTVEVVANSVTGVFGSSVEPGDLVDDFVSMTNYDPFADPAPDKTVGGIVFTGGKTVSSANPIYLSTIYIYAGVPNILDIAAGGPETPATFDMDLNTGDTVIVRARKQEVAQEPPFAPPFENVKMSATLAVSGSPVVAQGPQQSSTDDKAGFTFSFTVR
jgi:hypothetical protein